MALYGITDSVELIALAVVSGLWQRKSSSETNQLEQRYAEACANVSIRTGLLPCALFVTKWNASNSLLYDGL